MNPLKLLTYLKQDGATPNSIWLHFPKFPLASGQSGDSLGFKKKKKTAQEVAIHQPYFQTLYQSDLCQKARKAWDDRRGSLGRRTHTQPTHTTVADSSERSLSEEHLGEWVQQEILISLHIQHRYKG